MKTCTHCHQQKEISEFYTHPQMGDGHLGKCKECCKAYQRGRDCREYDRMRFHRSTHRRAYSYAKAREHSAKYPERKKARSSVSNAIRSGRLKRLPCSICGSSTAEAHHPDYSKPLEVQWLCKEHHELLHAGLITI